MSSLAQFVHEEEYRKTRKNFRRGQKVLVGVSQNRISHRRYFSSMSADGRYLVFASGMTEWSSKGKVEEWSFCSSDE